LIALALVLGGALGNLTDRIFRGSGVLDGHVVDWIDWWFIPTFNIADAALNVGVAVLLLSALLVIKRDE
jgi:signal peptidase II